MQIETVEAVENIEACLARSVFMSGGYVDQGSYVW